MNKQKTILIAEDERPMASVLKRKIESLGFQAVMAKDGNEAIKLFSKKTPALVLLDIVMPKKNGYRVLEHIRIAKQSNVPVIILSNLGQKNDQETGRLLGANAYLIKSNTSLNSIVQKINQLVGPVSVDK